MGDGGWESGPMKIVLALSGPRFEQWISPLSISEKWIDNLFALRYRYSNWKDEGHSGKWRDTQFLAGRER